MAVQILARVEQAGAVDATVVDEIYSSRVRTLIKRAMLVMDTPFVAANGGFKMGPKTTQTLLELYREARTAVTGIGFTKVSLLGVPFTYDKETPSDNHRVYLFGFRTIYWFAFHFYKTSGKGFLEVREYPLEEPVPAPEVEDDEPVDTMQVLKASLKNLVGSQKASTILAKQNPDYRLKQAAISQLIFILMYPGRWKIA